MEVAEKAITLKSGETGESGGSRVQVTFPAAGARGRTLAGTQPGNWVNC